MSLWPLWRSRTRSYSVLQRRVRVEGIEVAYQECGSGEPVVLVHGLSGSTLWWSRNIAALAQRYRVITLDLPGFGSLRRHGDRFALESAALWLRAFLAAAGVRRPYLIGHSMGGYICLRLAAEEPQLVRRLVLAAPAGVPLAASVFGEVVPLVGAVRYAAPSFLPVLAYDALRAGPRTLWSAARDIIRLNVGDELRSVRAPVLLVWGDRDRLVPPVNGEVLLKRLPNARLVVLPGAGHVAMYDRAAEFNSITLAFLAGEEVDVEKPSWGDGMCEDGRTRRKSNGM